MSDVPVGALDRVYIDPAFYAAAVTAQMSLADAARLAKLSYYVHFGTFDQDQNTLEMGGWLGNPFPGSRAPMIAKWKFGEAVMMSANMARGVPIAGPLLSADEQSRACGWQGMVMVMPTETTAPGLAVAASRGAQQHDRVIASAGLFFMTKTPDEAELLGVQIVHGDEGAYSAARALAGGSVTDGPGSSFSYTEQRSHADEEFPYTVRHTLVPGFQGIACILKIAVPGGSPATEAVQFFEKVLGVDAVLPDYTKLPTMLVAGERESDGYSHIGVAIAPQW